MRQYQVDLNKLQFFQSVPQNYLLILHHLTKHTIYNPIFIGLLGLYCLILDRPLNSITCSSMQVYSFGLNRLKIFFKGLTIGQNL